MTHEEIESLLDHESRLRRQQDMRHIASLVVLDKGRMSSWRHQTTVNRYILTACLILATWMGTNTAVAQTRPQQDFAKDSESGYNYIVSQGEPAEAYDSLSKTLLNI